LRDVPWRDFPLRTLVWLELTHRGSVVGGR
jgi:hypothetical protein